MTSRPRAMQYRPVNKHQHSRTTWCSAQSRGAQDGSSSSCSAKLLRVSAGAPSKDSLPLYFFPGTDGTGQAILPQVSRLSEAGFDVQCLYLSAQDRSAWEALTAKTRMLVSESLRELKQKKGLVVAESFGACLALRLASQSPELFEGLVLLNPATSFNASLGGLPALISATNLLGFFPESWYRIAQTVLLPLLVDDELVGAEGRRALEQMIMMRPPKALQDSFTGLGASSAVESQLPFGYAPAAAAQHRVNLLREGNLPDHELRRIEVPTLVLASARDRLFPSLLEGARLQKVMPRAQRLILPNSCHAALLETSINLAGLLAHGNMLPRGQKRTSKAESSTELSSSPNSTGDGLRHSPQGSPWVPPHKAATSPHVAHSPHTAMTPPLSAPLTATHTSRDTRTASSAHRVSSNPPHRRVVLATLDSQLPPPRSTPLPGVPSTPLAPVAASLTNTLTQQTAASTPSTAAASSYVSTAGNAASPAAASTAGTLADGTLSAAASSMPATTAGGLPSDTAASTQSSIASSTPDAVATGTPISIPRSTQGSMQSSTAASTSNSTAASISDAVTAHTHISSDDTPAAHTPMATPLNLGLVDDVWDEATQFLAPWRDLVSPVVLGTEFLPAPPLPPSTTSHSSEQRQATQATNQPPPVPFPANPPPSTVPPAASRSRPGPAARPRPLLFVGNHQKMGLYDMPLLMYELYMRGFQVKGLAHPGHWSSPLGSVFEKFGAVKATPRAAYRLLRAGESVLLFPGGAKEVNKSRAQEYRLLWQDTPDFVRLAARFHTTIVPFAAVGADDAYDVVMEVEDMLNDAVLGPVLVNAINRFAPSLNPREALLPLTRLPSVGVPSLIPVPNLQRLYFKFCEPIDTRLFAGVGAEQLYEQVKGQVENAIGELLVLREADQGAQLASRLEKGLKKLLPKPSTWQAEGSSHADVHVNLN